MMIGQCGIHNNRGHSSVKPGGGRGGGVRFLGKKRYVQRY